MKVRIVVAWLVYIVIYSITLHAAACELATGIDRVVDLWMRKPPGEVSIAAYINEKRHISSTRFPFFDSFSAVLYIRTAG